MSVLHEHTNSEHERISIERVDGGTFDGDLLLVVHDDPPPRGTSQRAPMLLDSGLRAWLRERLDELDEPTDVAERQAVALERIADRLDSWTHDPTREPERFAEEIAGLDERGPELRVRRW